MGVVAIPRMIASYEVGGGRALSCSIQWQMRTQEPSAPTHAEQSGQHWGMRLMEILLNCMQTMSLRLRFVHS